MNNLDEIEKIVDVDLVYYGIRMWSVDYLEIKLGPIYVISEWNIESMKDTC